MLHWYQSHRAKPNFQFIYNNSIHNNPLLNESISFRNYQSQYYSGNISFNISLDLDKLA